MVSQAKLEANRRNAQKSTGPRTPEGKARSSRNRSTSHHLFLPDLLLPTENLEESKHFRKGFLFRFQPNAPWNF